MTTFRKLHFCLVPTALVLASLAGLCAAQTAYTPPKNGAILIGFDFSDKPVLAVYGDSGQAPLNSRFTAGNGKIVTFKIKNVNRFAYDVTLKGERVELFGQMPELFKSKLLPSSGEKGKGGNMSADTAAEEIRTQLNPFNTIAGNLLDIAELDETLTSMARNYTRLNESMIALVKENARLFAAKPLEALGIKLKPGELAGDTLKTNSAIISFAKKPALSKLNDQFDALQAVFTAKYDMITDPKVKEAVKKEFDSAKAIYDAIVLADKVTTIGQQTELDKEFAASAAIYESILSGTAFETQNSTRAGGDYVKFSYEIKPKVGVVNALPEVKDDVSIPVHGSFRVTYSTGLFASELTDFNAEAVTSNGQQTVVAKGSEDYLLSIGALAHFYWRAAGDWHRFQPAFSVGALTSGSQTQFLIGGSLIFGSDQRIVLTIGRAFGPAKRLAPGVVLGQALPTGITDATQTRNTDAWFLGITYNFK